MKIWKFEIVWSGMIAAFYIQAIIVLKDVQLVNLCGYDIHKDSTLAKWYKCKTFLSYKEMLRSDSIEIVTIATPSGVYMEPIVGMAKTRSS